MATMLKESMSHAEEYFINKIGERLFGIHFGTDKDDKHLVGVAQFAKAEGVSIGDILEAIRK